MFILFFVFIIEGSCAFYGPQTIRSAMITDQLHFRALGRIMRKDNSCSGGNDLFSRWDDVDG